MKTGLLERWADAAADVRRYGVVNAARLMFGLPRRPKPVEPGLNTEADAEAFVKAMHEPGQLAADEPRFDLHPIFDEVSRLWPTIDLGRERALRAPTQEIRATFDSLVRLLAADWLCSHCSEGDHRACPGCSCMSCSAVAVGAGAR